MRRLSPIDLSWAARSLLDVPPSLRYFVCHSFFDRVHIADKIRKRTGVATCHGTGSILSALEAHSLPQEPFVNDPDYAHALMVVTKVILDRHRSQNCVPMTSPIVF